MGLTITFLQEVGAREAGQQMQDCDLRRQVEVMQTDVCVYTLVRHQRMLKSLVAVLGPVSLWTSCCPHPVECFKATHDVQEPAWLPGHMQSMLLFIGRRVLGSACGKPHLAAANIAMDAALS